MEMNKETRDQICEHFHTLSEADIHAATMVMREGTESDKLMSQGYILAIERARTILRIICRDK